MEHLNVDSHNSVIDTVVDAIDNKNINDVEKLNKEINENSKSDVIFELYNNKLLTSERLQFLMNKCSKYFNISSSNLIKTLIKDENIFLFDIIFSYLKFYDNEFIIQLLFYYKNETTISTLNLNQQISNEKYSINIEYKRDDSSIAKYLIYECKKKDINIYIIKYLVEHGTDINKTNNHGETPLFEACRSGNVTIVKYLVEHGADINKTNNYGNIPLFNACYKGNEAIVKYLVKLGVDINKANKYGDTPLFEACKNGNEAVVKYLVEHGANINKKSSYSDETPIFKACSNGNVAIVKYLVEHGADVNKKTKYGKTPLSVARRKSNEEIINYLLEHGTVE